MLANLKRRWGVRSNFQFWLIFISFSVAGSAVVRVKRPVFDLIGITAEQPLWWRITATVLVGVPLYQILLLAIGSALGQFQFFWAFEKKFIRRLTGNRWPAAPAVQPAPHTQS